MTRANLRWGGLPLVGLLAVLSTGDGRAQPESRRTDRHDDPLPAGAVARLGTMRWRHAEPVNFVAFLPDGKAILTGSQDRTLRLWDRATGKEIRRFNIPGMQPSATGPGRVVRTPFLASQLATLAALSSDGKVLATTANNALQLWDVDTGKEIRPIQAPANGVTALQFAPDGKMLAVRGGDQAIHLFATDSGVELRAANAKQPSAPGRVVAGRLGDNGSLAFARDGKLLASPAMELDQQNLKGFVRVSNVETGAEVCRIETAPNGVSALAFLPGGKALALAVGADIILHDPQDGKEIRKLNVPAGVAALLVTPDGKHLIVKGRNDVVRILNAETGQEQLRVGEPALFPAGVNVALFRFLNRADHTIALSADGRTVVAGAGNSIRLWDVATGKEQPLLGGHQGPVGAVTITRDGTTAVSRGTDNVIRCWDLADGREISRFHEPDRTLAAVVAPDGQTVACSVSDGTVRVLETSSGKQLRQFRGSNASTLVFSRDGTRLASVAGDGSNTIVMHDAVSGVIGGRITLADSNGNGIRAAVVLRTPIQFAGGPSFAFSPDNKTLVGHFPANSGPPFGNVPGGAATTVVRLWDVATGKELRRITLPAGRGTDTGVLSPDGRVLASENADGTVALWELASGHERSTLGKPQAGQPINAAAMPRQAALVRIIGGPTRIAADGLAFSPDGRLAAFKGPANSIQVWDIAAGAELGAFLGHDGPVTSLTFTPDGRRLVSGSNDTTVLVWNVAGLGNPSTLSALELQPKALLALWDDLGGDDARKAFHGIQRLAAGARQAVPFLRTQVKPAVPPDPKKLDRLIAQLDSDDFEERNGATDELARLGGLAVPALQKVVAGQPTLEARRRVEALLLRLTTGALTTEQVRQVRVIEALELAGTSEARQLLDALAKGAPGALTTVQAQGVIDRLR